MIYNKEQLREEAHKAALRHDPFISRKPSARFLQSNESDLEKLRGFVNDLRDNRSSCSQPAEEWLLDNAEFLEEQVLVVNQGLTKGFVNSLPHLKKTGDSRVFSICTDYLQFNDGHLEMDSFISYLQSYQEVSLLKMAEVWAMPLIMRVALIRRLAEIMDTVKERRDVCSLVEKLLSGIKASEITPEKLKQVLEEAGQEMPLSGLMIVHLVKHLRERADYTATVGEWLICKLENGPESLDHILSYEFQLQAAFQVTTGNLITSMRKLSRWDWNETFEQISMVEQSLRKERTGFYSQLDFSSRDTLRKRVEQLARRLNLPENLVAAQAVELADKYGEEPSVEVSQKGENSEELAEKYGKELHERNSTERNRPLFVAYYLLDPNGIMQLRQALKMCGKPRTLPETGLMRRATGTYFNMLAVCFVVFLLGFSIWIGWDELFSPIQWLAILGILLFPVTEWAVTSAHWFIERVKGPVPLLRFDFSKGISADAKTMVVIPVIWSSIAEVKELAERLELHYLANRDSNLHFGLLGDFKDAETESLEQDEVILTAAKREIEQLRNTYSNTNFHLFQRKRKWIPSEGVWMGWERKRGKLVEFVEFLKGREDTSFAFFEADLSLLQDVRYIITLDSDTQLPLESAQRMIGTLHLPYNQPVLNDTKTRVIEGYGVLQPRLSMSHQASMSSRFSSLWSTNPGFDPYAFAVSDPYQDALGQGIFTGKGIFEVDTFYQVLCERIPDNRVLSHDLLEGGFLRAGLLSDIELIDHYPSKFIVFQKRQHRWVRGDWQLLLWLLPRLYNRRGELMPVDLSVLTRWQIIDNMRRSLLSTTLFVTLLLAVTILPGSPLRWIAFVAATWFLPVLRQIVTVQTGLMNLRSILNTTVQVLLGIVILPFQIVLLLDAIGRTLYRLLFSKKRLLEWVSSDEENRKSNQKDAPLLQGMAGGYVLCILFLAATLFNENIVVQIIGLTLSVMWMCAPFVISWLDQPSPQDRITFSEDEMEELTNLAQQIWSFYEDYVTEKENWLPPDNVQMEPPNGVAHRTSPTNIGMYLTCALAARDFSFIDTPGLILRLERTLETLERMEKWEGHFYNWYDTETLNPLSPRYVSTVDSGNLVGCLITVKEGLAEWLEAFDKKENPTYHFHNDETMKIAFSEEITPDFSRRRNGKKVSVNWRDRGQMLLKRLEELIEETNFQPLFDHRAKLFSLGYHADRNTRDEVLYDLMASEARIASFVAIALGQVSVSHWHVLGRTMTRVGKRPVLLSWSGTMFEYLMPWLLMRTYRKTLWENTYAAVVDRQIQYAHQRGVPFGISESGYYAFDYQMNYQYRAFGVPGLGFKRGLEQDLVIAPYATIMALPFAKDQALDALKKIEQLNGRGKYGFYEAMDFTQERLPNDKQHKVIQSFMAHHQGMSLLTLANLLLPKTMVERFHRNKQIRSAELLLQERIPKTPKYIKHPALGRVHKQNSKSAQDAAKIREYISPDTRVPEVSVLSNGSFTTVVTNTGSGFSQYKGLLVSRWREDPVMDPWGNYVYIRDISEDKLWSPSYQPCRVESSEQRVQFGLDRATFMRVDGDVKTSMEIVVSSEMNAELRRITLTNSGEEAKVLEVTTFVELALSNPIADVAHTAFSKLFIRTAFDAESGCLVAGRRPREAKDQTLWSAHSLLVDGDTLGSVEFETDRSSFIGRGYRLSDPQGIRTRLRGKVGSVADPAFVMRRRICIEPGKQIQLVAVTSVSETKEDAIEIVRKFAPDQAVERAFQLSWNRGQIEIRNLHLTNQEATDFQRLAGYILYTSPFKKDRGKSILINTKGQSGLWSFGVSGDRPIVLLRIEDRSQMPFVVKMLTGHEYIRRLGLLFDLVLLNESEEGYYQHLQEALQQVAEHGVDRFGVGLSGVYVIASNQLSAEDKALLMAVARVELRAGGASLATQMRLPKGEMENGMHKIGTPNGLLKDETENGMPEQLIPVTSAKNKIVFSGQTIQEETKEWLFFNGWGGFSPDGKEYRIMIKNGNHLPAPWINVLANPRFGSLISEMGSGYTWWRNSRECKLTPWSNDPVLDPPTETAYLRDEESGKVWSAAPSAVHSNEPYKITHGKGFTKFDHERNGIKHEMLVYVPLEDPVKIIRLKLQNKTSEQRHISLTYYAEWVLGVQRQANAPFIVTDWVESERVMIAKNTYQETFRDATVFLGIYPQRGAVTGSGEVKDSGIAAWQDSSGAPGEIPGSDAAKEQDSITAPDQVRGSVSASDHSYDLTWTADRNEFIGRNGSMEHPAAMGRVGLSCRTGTHYESCGAIQTKLTLKPGEEQVVYILLGCDDSKERVLQLARKYSQSSACEQAMDEVIAFWDHHLGQIQVSTPSKETDFLLNGWLLYQSLACRIWARTAFYQAGGAFGFRDQLQDSLALLHTMPEKTREQIVLHASHQYIEGDVQHWWHEETERGIRTTFSDDLLWMPYVVSRYIEHSGDRTVLDEVAPFLISEPLAEGEHERYEPTVRSSETGTVYEHCLRAIDRALSRIGEHGLPLIGVGDWNDGMNQVGVKGRGESVWLGWFICDVLNRFAELCGLRGDSERVEAFQKMRQQLTDSLNEQGWDGQWYRRAFTDAGQWLGSIQNEECRIDAIAQSWSVISGAAPMDRAVQAMNSFDRELVERDLAVVRLLTPAFDQTEPSPGYIQGYPPGIRENGAQYTHGVIWGIIAWCQLGNGDKAMEMFTMLNPMTHTRTDHEVRRYTGEPYAIAADVYTAEPNQGHSGWTWYTGASGWFYQAGIEWILGIRRRETRLYLNPRIPSEWPGFSITYRFGNTRYHINVKNGSGGNECGLTVDGVQIPISEEEKSTGPFVELRDDGLDHHVGLRI
ncbi:Cellobiose phosphorylase [Bacillus sp. OV166]|uniref:GH36-type glycosyl hydrolase domain-containing protein n=1 Tax=Bacillus sp. OV166 TaxID=1882763 RepID=UPI000A2AC358|nr:glucoamylase family protein [Bacillus sp. OV166]SMQ61055.1 Cellobiose phosphorylase [Bacillus sp. OV166]